MNLRQVFAYESLDFHYFQLKEKFTNSESKTRNKSIVIPKRQKTVSSKSSFIRSIALYNNLPNELKTIRNVHTRKCKLKAWVLSNV